MEKDIDVHIMPNNKKSFKKLISLARHSSKKGREHLIRRAPSWFIRGCIRAASLSRQGRLSAKSRRKLAPYKRDVQYLSQCKNMNKARNKLIQRGGFLPALIPILIGLGKAAAGAAAGAAATALVRKIVKK